MKHGHQTIVEVQYLRAIAVLLVFLGHAHQNEGRFFSDTAFGDYMYFGFAGVDVFFVISGFIIHTLYRDHSGVDPVFYLHRLNRIFPMYWVFTLGAMLGYWLVLGRSLGPVMAETDWVRTLTLWPGNEAPLLPVAWTLTHELYFYLTYAVFLAFPVRWRVHMASAWLLITLIGLVIPDRNEHPLFQLMISPFNLLFLAGVALAEWRKRFERFGVLAVVTTVSGLILGLIYTGSTGLPGLENVGVRVAVFAPFAVGLCWCFLALKPKLPSILVAIGDWSYALYLGHTLVLDVLARLLVPRIDGALLDSLIFYPLGFILVLIMSAIAHHGFERPALAVGKSIIKRFHSH
ncbi:MAG: acyltransferase [Alphaproteobacteria bacterium]|nr:acyltransferase [Alphaproteobacteria bacterium]